MKNNKLRENRKRRVRAKVKGTKEMPRLSVFRGLKSISAQLVDDQSGKTLCSAHSRETSKAKTTAGKKSEENKAKVAAAYSVGKLLADKAKEKGISKVCFDRAGYKYHGRVAALADGARTGGLVF